MRISNNKYVISGIKMKITIFVLPVIFKPIF